MDYNRVPTQTCVLKMNVQCCARCPNKLKKLLQKIDGVYSITIDVPRGMVTISGKADPTMLIKMIEKSGKKAELWSFQKDPIVHDQNKLEYKFRYMHIAQGNCHCNTNKYIQYGGLIDQQCCNHNNYYDKYHNNFSPIALNAGSNGYLQGSGSKYGARNPYYQQYGEERAYGNQSYRPVMYDMPPPAYDYFHPQPPPLLLPPPPVANPMTHYLSDENARGCSVM